MAADLDCGRDLTACEIHNRNRALLCNAHRVDPNFVCGGFKAGWRAGFCANGQLATPIGDVGGCLVDCDRDGCDSDRDLLNLARRSIHDSKFVVEQERHQHVVSEPCRCTHGM